MNALEFARAVLKHINRALKSNCTGELVEANTSQLDRVLPSDAHWYALDFLILCVRPPKSLGLMFLIAGSSEPSARSIAKFIISLADKTLQLAAETGVRAGPDERQEAVVHFLEVYLLGLAIQASQPRSTNCTKHVGSENKAEMQVAAHRVLAGWGSHMLDPDKILALAKLLQDLAPERRQSFLHGLAQTTTSQKVASPGEFEVLASSEARQTEITLFS